MNNNCLPKLLRLVVGIDGFCQKTKLLAVAVTATEMHFRPLTFRCIEYLVVILRLCVGRDVGSFSVGISQVSLRHYMVTYRIGPFAAIRLAMSAEENLKICCALLDSWRCETIEAACDGYNGNSTIFYKRLLSRNYHRAYQLASQRASVGISPAPAFRND